MLCISKVKTLGDITFIMIETSNIMFKKYFFSQQIIFCLMDYETM